MKATVAGETAMNKGDPIDRRVRTLFKALSCLNKDFVENGSFSLEDHELVQEKTIDLMEQLKFWMKEDNKERFCYELTQHIKWFLRTFSDDTDKSS